MHSSADLPAHQWFLIRQLRILLLAIKGFTEDNIQLRASALTLFSMLSIVPVLAVAFGIAQGFGFEEKLNEQICLFFSAENQQQVLEWMITFANNMLANTKGGIIAGVGVLMLFWSVMKVFTHIENSMNQIWQIKRGRSFFRKISDYLSLMLLGPLLIMLSSGITVFMSNLINAIAPLQFLGTSIINIFPYLLIWILFMLVYIIMPNTKVQIKSAMIAGIIAGTIFQLVQFAYVNFQGLLSRYGAIYGSFAALPLFMLWLQISWIILLFGAEIAFANQNIEKYEFESESLHISQYYRKILTFLIAQCIIKNFEQGLPALTSAEISHKLALPVRIVRDITYELTECNILSRTLTDNSNKDYAYQPALDINKISIAYLLEKIDKRGIDDLDAAKTNNLKRFREIQDSILKTIENAPLNKLIKDL